MFTKISQITLMGILAMSLMAFSPVSVDGVPMGSILPADEPQTSTLTDEEVSGLLLMREEEKLAHDVYMYLYDVWGLNVFNNIAASEQTHTEAVKTLLDTYGIKDPVEGNTAGEFTNPELQALYDRLTAQGSESLGAALKVGAAVEEIDILDLREALGQTTNPDIQRVFDNLEKGSENHLGSFTSTLTAQTGEEYQPQHLAQDDYQTIINNRSSGNPGNGQGNGNGTGMGSGNGNGTGAGSGSMRTGGKGNSSGSRRGQG